MVVFALIGVVAWHAVGGNLGRATISDSMTYPSESSQQSNGQHTPRAISSGAADAPSLDRQGDTVRFSELTSGRSFSVALRSLQTILVSDRRISGFIRSYWLPDDTGFIRAVDVRGTVEYQFFAGVTDTPSRLGAHVVSFAVAPSGTLVAMLETSEEGMVLVTMHPSGSHRKELLKLRAINPEVVWANDRVISIIQDDASGESQSLFVVSLDGTILPLVEHRKNLAITWSPDGTSLLISSADTNNQVSLSYVDLSSRIEIPLGMPTSADKCAWHHDGHTITCGIPSNTHLSATTSAERTATIDDLVTLDIRTSKSTRFYSANPDRLIGVFQPLVSASDRYLVFSNIFDQRLYSIEL